MGESKTETFWYSKVERDVSLMLFVSRPRREQYDETLTIFSDFQYFGTRPGPRLLEKKEEKNRWVQDWDLSIIKIGARPRRDRESRCLQSRNQDETESLVLHWVQLPAFTFILNVNQNTISMRNCMNWGRQWTFKNKL